MLYTIISKRSKPSQHSLMHSTCQHNFYFNSSMDLFVPKCIHLYNSYHTSQTLNFRRLLYFSLHFTHPMSLPRTMSLLQLLLHADTFSQFSVPPHHLIHSAYHILFTSSFHCDLGHQALHIIYSLERFAV